MLNLWRCQFHVCGWARISRSRGIAAGSIHHVMQSCPALQNSRKTPEMFTSHEALSLSNKHFAHHVMSASQIRGSRLQGGFLCKPMSAWASARGKGGRQIRRLSMTQRPGSFPKALRHKLGEYFNTNGSRSALHVGVLSACPFPQPSARKKSVHASVLFSEVVRVAASETTVSKSEPVCHFGAPTWVSCTSLELVETTKVCKCLFAASRMTLSQVFVTTGFSCSEGA